MKLPPELPNYIYVLVLKENVKQLSFPLNAHLPLIPAVLQLCKEVRTEASGLFWSLNTLIFSVGTNITDRQPQQSLAYHGSMNRGKEN